MPAKTPKGSGALKTGTYRIAETLGYNGRAIQRSLGVSYYQALKIKHAAQENKPAREFIGTGKAGEKRAAAYSKAIEKSGWIIREQRIQGKKRLAAIPPEPVKGRRQKRTSQKKFKNAVKTEYKYDPAKKIPFSDKAEFQIHAKGKGKSHGKAIKQLFGNVGGDWESAWASWRANATRTGFTASEISIIVIEPTESEEEPEEEE